MNDQAVPTDQTKFANEEPLFESKEEIKTAESPIAKKRKKILKLASLLLLTAMIGLWMLASMRDADLPQIAEEDAAFQVPPDMSDEYQKRLQEISQDLNQADPATLLLPYPPISDTLTIEQ